jgi:hypothetical protein
MGFTKSDKIESQLLTEQSRDLRPPHSFGLILFTASLSFASASAVVANIISWLIP